MMKFMGKEAFLVVAIVSTVIACGDSASTRGASGSVNNGLVSQYTLEATSNQPGSPYIDGDLVVAVVFADGRLTLDTLQLSSPSVEGAELVYVDSASGKTYRLSNNTTGVFNEINLFSSENQGIGRTNALFGVDDSS